MSALQVESPTVDLDTNTTSAPNVYSLVGGVLGHTGRVALVPQSGGGAWPSFGSKVLTSESSRRYTEGSAIMGDRRQAPVRETTLEHPLVRDNPLLHLMATRLNPVMFATRGSLEEGAREDRELMDEFSALRRKASENC